MPTKKKAAVDAETIMSDILTADADHADVQAEPEVARSPRFGRPRDYLTPFKDFQHLALGLSEQQWLRATKAQGFNLNFVQASKNATKFYSAKEVREVFARVYAPVGGVEAVALPNETNKLDYEFWLDGEPPVETVPFGDDHDGEE